MSAHIDTIKIRNLCLIALTTVFFIYLLLSLCFPLTAFLLAGFSAYDSKRILQILFLLIILISLLFSTRATQFVVNTLACFSHIFLLILLLILGIGLTSAFIAPSTKHALIEIALYIALFFILLLTASLYKQWPRQVVTAFVTILSINTLIYTLYFLIAFEHIGIFPGFSNLRFFAQFQIWTLPIFLLLTNLSRKNIFIEIGLISLIALYWALAIINGARGFWLGYAISFISIALIYRKAAKPLLKLQTQVLVVAFLFFLLFQSFWPNSIHIQTSNNIAVLQQIKSLQTTEISQEIGPLQKAEKIESTTAQSTTNKSSSHARIILWKDTIALVKEHPLFGAGAMHFAYYNNLHGAHPHNLLLLILVEWGIPATLLFVSLLLISSYWWIKKFNHQTLAQYSIKQPLVIILTQTTIAGLSYALVSGVGVTPLSQIMLVSVLGIMLGLYQNTNKHAPPTTHYWLQGVSILMLIFCITTFVLQVLPQIPTLTQNEIQWYFTNTNIGIPDISFRPRFWLQGYIGKF